MYRTEPDGSAQNVASMLMRRQGAYQIRKAMVQAGFFFVTVGLTEDVGGSMFLVC
jgi:hypothetical protein